MHNSAHNAYVEQRILAADPAELIRLLYGAAMEAVREARRHLADGEIAARSRAISRASSMVLELLASLDRNRGGEIAERLAQLYDYMLSRLTEANLRQSDAPLAEVLSLLATLSEAWSALRTEPGRASGSTAGATEAAASPWSQAAGAEMTGNAAAHAWSF
jgi:flagellar protein FliS